MDTKDKIRNAALEEAAKTCECAFAECETLNALHLAARIRALKRTPPAPSDEDDEEALHPDTSSLVDRFSEALREKLKAAQNKYGYGADWLKDNWKAECVKHLQEHIAKGDPRDVAAYCAFAWHHGWSVRPETPAPSEQSSAEAGFKALAEAAKGRWDGVDAIAYVNEQRGEPSTPADLDLGEHSRSCSMRGNWDQACTCALKERKQITALYLELAQARAENARMRKALAAAPEKLSRMIQESDPDDENDPFTVKIHVNTLQRIFECWLEQALAQGKEPGT